MRFRVNMYAEVDAASSDDAWEKIREMTTLGEGVFRRTVQDETQTLFVIERPTTPVR